MVLSVPADPKPYSLDDLLRVMERLRDPEHGCPWDVKQTFATIVPSTLEEAYELAEAIEQEDFPHVAEELGDLLFQVIFYAQLGREQGLFDLSQIISRLVDKLLRRHPHVFAEGQIEGVVEASASVAEVSKTWESIKQTERAARRQTSALDDVPVALPALTRAQKVQKRAASVGFDWPDAAAVFDKLDEERDELAEAATREEQADELGDLMFTCVNMARHVGLDAEAALRAATSKFEARFSLMEKKIHDGGASIEELSQQDLEAHWSDAKRAQQDV